MRRVFLFLVVFSGAPLGGCGLLDGAAPPPSSQADVLRPGDMVQVTVAGEEELTGTFPVNPDRTVHLELLGAVPAGGLSVTAFEDVLRQRLAQGYLKNPQVLVARAAAPATAAVPEAPSVAPPPPMLRASQTGQ